MNPINDVYPLRYNDTHTSMDKLINIIDRLRTFLHTTWSPFARAVSQSLPLESTLYYSPYACTHTHTHTNLCSGNVLYLVGGGC